MVTRAYTLGVREHGFADWLRGQMERRGLRQSQVAAYVGVTPAAVSRWLSGISRPDPPSVVKIADLFHERVARVYELAGHPNPDYVPEVRQKVSFQDQILEALADAPILVPVVEQLAAAGEGQIALDYVALPPQRAAGHSLAALVVRGESMAPEIQDGDYIVIDTDATARDGDTVVASIGEEVIVKRLQRKSDHFVLAGNNGKVVRADDAEIAGVVIQIVRDVPRG